LLRRLRIRAKLTLVSALPLLCLLGVVLAASFGRARAVAGSAELADQIRLSTVVDDVVHEIQRERGLSAGYAGGGFTGADRLRVEEQRAVVDRARGQLADAATRVRDTPAARALASARTRLDGIGDHRAAIDGHGYGVSATLGWYTDTVSELLQASAPAAASGSATDTALLPALTAYGALARAKEATALEAALLNGVLGQGSFQPDQYRQLLTLVGTQRAERDIFDTVASPAQRERLAAVFVGPELARAADMERRAIARPVERLEMVPDEWWDLMGEKADRYAAVEHDIATELEQAADAETARARTELLLVLGGGLALVAGTAVVVAVIARAILAPVTTLTARAYRAARTDLPRAIGALQEVEGDAVVDELPAVEVDSEDELAGLAAAFNSVQRAAIDLAVDQALLRRNVAEMFVNLGRRNQALIGRQLAFIDRLEQDEADPDQLEKLFLLDHMSTRMRRNAESLLVLAGAELPRRWSSSVPVVDIVRAGLSEIEDYRRIEVGDVGPVAVVGPAATDLTHLLAELLENATMFSAPSTKVEVHGAARAEGYLLAVVDHGVGLSTSQLGEANRRIEELARFDRSPSKMLGLYVVGRLAARHGITVRLVESVTQGITAKVLLPAGLLDHTAPAAEPVATLAGASVPAAGRVSAPVPVAVNGAGDATGDDGPPPLARRPRRSRPALAEAGPRPGGGERTMRALQVVPSGGPPPGDADADAADPGAAAMISVEGENSLRALRRRVRGAQLPDRGPGPSAPARPTPSDDGGGGPDRAAAVRASIGAFQQAVARGRSTTATETSGPAQPQLP
jgi:signal transduction histidine kinase